MKELDQSASIEEVVGKINEIVYFLNKLSKDRCNVGIDYLGYTTPISFQEAIGAVPEERRIPGITLKYNDIDLGWSEYMWNGRVWDDFQDWTRLENFIDIDGGEIDG